MVAFFVGALLRVKVVGPAFLLGGLAGVFVKGLFSKLGAAVAHVDDFAFAALFLDGGDAVILLEFQGALEALAIGPKGSQKARGQNGAGSGKATEEGRFRMLVHGGFNFLFDLSNGFVKALQEAGLGFGHEDGGVEQSGIFGEGLGALDGLEALFHQFCAAGVLRVEECPDTCDRSFLKTGQVGPFEKEGAEHGRGEVCKEDFQKWKVALGQAVQAIDDAGAFIDQIAAVLNQQAQFAGQNGVGPKGAQFAGMQAGVFLQEHGVGAVVFGAADAEGFTVAVEHLWVDGIDDNEVIGVKGVEERAAGSFNGERHGLIGETLAQLGRPGVNGFGSLCQDTVFRFAVGRLYPKVVFFVRPIDANGGGVRGFIG